MNTNQKAKSKRQIEAEIQRIQLEERLDRIASFFIPFIRAVLLTGAMLYVFNQFVV